MATATLLGRASECAALDELVASVRAGPSRDLVLRGEAGVGKSALLEYLVRQASRYTIARAAGVESEAEIAFAGLQQLCAPCRPLICIVDDAQCGASAQALAFVARRLGVESVGLVLAVREPSAESRLDGLAEMVVAGPEEQDALGGQQLVPR